MYVMHVCIFGFHNNMQYSNQAIKNGINLSYENGKLCLRNYNTIGFFKKVNEIYFNLALKKILLKELYYAF